MAKYIVYLNTVASTSIEVEADNEDDAMEKAYDSGMPTICAQCSGWNQPHNLDLGDEWEATDVQDADGRIVWTNRPRAES